MSVPFAWLFAWALAVAAASVAPPLAAADAPAPAKDAAPPAPRKAPAAAAGLPSADPHKEKLDAIRKLIKNAYEAAPPEQELSKAALHAAILDEVRRKFPCDESKPPHNSAGGDELDSMVEAKVAEKYPMTEEAFRRKVLAESEGMFKPLDPAKGESVTVRYSRGGSVYEASGVYYGWDSDGRSIRIGKSVVPYVDILPEQQHLFSAAAGDKRRDEHVRMKVFQYKQERERYASPIRAEIKRKMDEENTARGYIYYLKAWRTPVRSAELLLQDMKLARRQQAASAAPQEADAANSAAKGADAPAGEKSLKQLRIEAKAAAEEKLAAIKARFFGVDQDQGYHLATWGMTREDFCLLFRESHAPAPAASAVEVVDYPEGFTSKVEFAFINDILYKVTVHFRIGTTEAMTKILANIFKRYGRSDEEKKQAFESASAADAASPGQSQGSAPASISNEAVWTWTGEQTVARLTAKGDAAKDIYTMVQLVKESPAIYNQQIEEQKRRKEEEIEKIKRREIDEANKFDKF